MPHATESTISQAMRQCIEECTECHNTCTETVQHSLLVGGDYASPQLIKTLLDCAQICQTSADFLSRGSEYHTGTCAVCAEVCRACERECRRMESDEVMKKCADVCARCAESCEKMAGAIR